MILYHLPIPVPVFIMRLCVWGVLLYRKIRYGKAYRQIALTQGKYAIVDVEDFAELNKYKWYAVNAGHTFYAVQSMYTENRKRIIVKMHRQIMRPDKDTLVDHIYHNGLDNRRGNLRLATAEQNSWNRRIRKIRDSSKYIGVRWCKYHKKWRVSIRRNGRKEHLGYFDSETEVAKIYDAAAKKYRGEFAVSNFGPPNKFGG